MSRRKPKLFYISSSTTTSTLTTSTVCYVSSTAAPVACTKRKRRAMVVEPDEEINFDERNVSQPEQDRWALTGAARLNLCDELLCLQTRSPPSPALPPTAHICANHNWFLPKSKYLSSLYILLILLYIEVKKLHHSYRCLCHFDFPKSISFF